MMRQQSGRASARAGRRRYQSRSAGFELLASTALVITGLVLFFLFQRVFVSLFLTATIGSVQVWNPQIAVDFVVILLALIGAEWLRRGGAGQIRASKTQSVELAVALRGILPFLLAVGAVILFVMGFAYLRNSLFAGGDIGLIATFVDQVTLPNYGFIAAIGMLSSGSLILLALLDRAMALSIAETTARRRQHQYEIEHDLAHDF